MEGIIIQSGPCGCFQFLHVCFTQATRYAAVWSLYFMIFGNFNPGWRCASRYNGSHNGTDDRNYSSVIRTSRIDRDGFYDINNNSMSTTPMTSSGDELVESDSIDYNDVCEVFDSCQSIEFNPVASTIVTEFGLICGKTWIIPLILFVQGVGMIPGSLIWGQVGERYGRKAGLYGSTLLMGLCNVFIVFSPNWEVYMVLTTIMAQAGLGVISCAPVLTLEFLSPKWRGVFGSIPIWNIATLNFAGLVILLKDWRYIHITNAVFTGLSCLGYFWVPESVRWLAVKKRKEKAIKVVHQIVRYNRKPTPDLEAIERFSNTNTGDDDKQFTYLDLFRSRKILIIVVKFIFVKMVAVCTYNVLGFGVYSLPGDFFVNIAISSGAEIPIVFLVGFLANKLGRRWTAFGYSGVNVICFSTILLSSLFMEDGFLRETIVKIGASVGRGCAITLIILMQIMFVENLPTVLRSVGVGFIFTVARAGGVISPFLLPTDNSSFIVCFSVLTGLAVISCTIFPTFTETNKLNMTDFVSESNRSKDVKKQIGRDYELELEIPLKEVNNLKRDNSNA